MNAILQFHKHRFETPLQMLERMRKERPELKDEKLSYLGRLDPLATGVMLVAVGEANKEREKYLGLSKTYKAAFLFGVSTDTGDVLGMVREARGTRNIDLEKIEKEITNLTGKHFLHYPAYSSKTVQGIPLHEHTRKGKTVDIPVRSMEVVRVHIFESYKISGATIAEQGIEAAEKVKGDFRQEEIRGQWQEFKDLCGKEVFQVVTVELQVTSGTYIRSLAELLGETTHTPCLAWSIERIAFSSDLW